MEGLEENWYEYPVFHIDFNSVNFSEPGALENVLEGAVGTWEQKFGRSAFYDVIGKRFAHVLHEARQQTGRRCVVLIDEYDKPLLDVLDSDMTIRIGENERKLEEWNREVLKGFYSGDLFCRAYFTDGGKVRCGAGRNESHAESQI